ncbi:hypothetical protein [Burkholderia vietnamiensis]|uniref:hypothetical protein n=1 Tax=Burkholderia vietnamiensis TaxID=60552 RepID=UPI0012DAD287|nr:hypothetical protein [Burkholderia vietnamiensis]MCA7943231.1 hypothetical protein [Burkholderia vietnamiensis]HDR9126244.1 hypothetical protein [Burkholderia vietnamiensis]
MSKRPDTFVDALLAEEASAERVRDAFRELGRTIERMHKSHEEKRQEIKRDIKDGARVTKHRFHI